MLNIFLLFSILCCWYPHLSAPPLFARTCFGHCEDPDREGKEIVGRGERTGAGPAAFGMAFHFFA